MILPIPHRTNRSRLPRPVSLSDSAATNHVLWTACCTLVLVLAVCSPPCEAAGVGNATAGDTADEVPVFTVTADGDMAFDTGVLEGRLNAAGRALGLTGVVHQPTGRRLSGGLGLMQPYRIFSGNHRFGDGARDWKTSSRLLDDGAVEVRWQPPFDVPFELSAVYRWHDATTLDMHVGVRAVDDLPTFEVFLASYFYDGFADPFVYVAEPDGGTTLMLGEESMGSWLMSPRDAAAVTKIRDGRWRVPPSPVDWVLLPRLAGALAVRRDRHSDLAAVVMAPKADCFAVSMPYARDAGHRSLYLSLLGCDIAAGQQAHARARLVIGDGLSDADVVDDYHRYQEESSQP